MSEEQPPQEEKAVVTEEDLQVFDHRTDQPPADFAADVLVSQLSADVVKTPEEERACCKKCCGCYPLGDQPKLDEEVMDDEAIKQEMKENLEAMTPAEKDAIMKYADMRATYQGPFQDFWEDAIEQDENYRVIFSLSQMTSRVWTDKFCTDLWLFSLQKHPLLGFMAHHTHPLELADRTFIFITGFCICLINQIAPLCDREVCENTCFHMFVNNGVCEDGGNFTWAGRDSNYSFAADYQGSDDFSGGLYQLNGPYACDYGTDCMDCGVRDSEWLRRAAVDKSHPDSPGLWCFSNEQVYVKTVLMTFMIIPVSFTVITNLLLCKCCITQDNVQRKIFWTDFGQNLGNLIVVCLVTFAGYLTKSYIDRGVNFLVLLANKAFVFSLIGGINVAVFIMSYKSTKAKIYKYKGMRNFIRANYTLNGALDSASTLEDVKANRKAILKDIAESGAVMG